MPGERHYQVSPGVGGGVEGVGGGHRGWGETEPGRERERHVGGLDGG